MQTQQGPLTSRFAFLRDITALIDVDILSNAHPWGAKELQKAFNSQTAIRVVELDGQIVGFWVLRYMKAELQLRRFSWLRENPDIATALIERLLVAQKLAPRGPIVTTVCPDDTVLETLLLQHGFIKEVRDNTNMFTRNLP